jgi:hypothetical protein
VESIIARTAALAAASISAAAVYGVQQRSTGNVAPQIFGKEPGVARKPGKIRHLDLTGMNDGHAETSESGAE